MRNCQVRINMNYDVYIEGNEPVRLLSDIINEIYFTEEYTVTSEWEGEIPEDVLMRVLIYGYMNGAYSSRKIEQLCKRDDELDRLFKKIYEDNANGKISDERFEKMANGYETGQEKLKLTITELSSALTEHQEQSDNGKRFLNIVKRYTQITELTTEILHEFIDKILVYAPDKSSGRRVVRVDIYYNFVGAIDTSSLAA